MAYKLSYSDYPGTDTGPPDPERWIGPPGPQGNPGPVGPQGETGGITGGEMTGPLYYTATGGNTSRSAQDRAADEANVLDFRADPTGVVDSTTAIRAAIATGKNVFLPYGTYRVSGRINLGSLTKSQALVGDELGTTFLIDTTFDPAVTDGVVVVTGINRTDQRPSIRNITFKFEQPADIVTTATAASAAGINTITVASTTGIAVGMVAHNVTRANSIPMVYVIATSTLPCTVTSIVGDVLTLSQNILSAGVVGGDSIHFAPTRAMFKTLAENAGAPGGPGIKYPWAIYCSGNVQTLVLDNIMTIGAWNGIYIRGSSFWIGVLKVNAFSVGMDIDNCANFPSLNDYNFYQWGYGPADPYGLDRLALSSTYYDGSTVAATIGKCDGLSVLNFQTWVGQLNLTANWTWGLFANLMLDGNSSNLNITSATNAGWVDVVNCYSTKGSRTIGHSVFGSPTGVGFWVSIKNFALSSASILYRGIVLQNGTLAIGGGYLWDGLGSGLAFAQINGGTLRLANMRLDASAARTDTYISVTGAASVIQMNDCAFIAAPGVGAVGVGVGTDNVANNINGVVWNGWDAVGTNSGLSFDARLAASSADLSKHISLHPSGYGFSVTSARLNLAAPLTAAVASVVGGVEKFVVGNAQMIGNVPLNLIGGGIGFAAQTGATNVDLSKHVSLHTSGYGLSVTGGRLNVVAPTGAGVFMSVAGADILTVGATSVFSAVQMTASSFRVGSNQLVGARITGWGVATGGSKSALTAGTATLPQTAAAVAQLIADLTTHGLIGA